MSDAALGSLRADDYVVIGQIARAQGIRGQLKVRAITPDPGRFFELDAIFIEKNGTYEPRKMFVERVDGEYVFISLDGVPDRNAAEALSGTYVYVDRSHTIELPENAAFVCDLIGCEGITDAGESIGRVVEVLQNGGIDVYVFDGVRRVMIPALLRVMPKVDIAAKIIRINAERMAEVAVYE